MDVLNTPGGPSSQDKMSNRQVQNAVQLGLRCVMLAIVGKLHLTHRSYQRVPFRLQVTPIGQCGY